MAKSSNKGVKGVSSSTVPECITKNKVSGTEHGVLLKLRFLRDRLTMIANQAGAVETGITSMAQCDDPLDREELSVVGTLGQIEGQLARAEESVSRIAILMADQPIPDPDRMIADRVPSSK